VAVWFIRVNASIRIDTNVINDDPVTGFKYKAGLPRQSAQPSAAKPFCRSCICRSDGTYSNFTRPQTSERLPGGMQAHGLVSSANSFDGMNVALPGAASRKSTTGCQ